MVSQLNFTFSSVMWSWSTPPPPHVLEVGNSYFAITRAFRKSSYSQVEWSCWVTGFRPISFSNTDYKLNQKLTPRNHWKFKERYSSRSSIGWKSRVYPQGSPTEVRHFSNSDIHNIRRRSTGPTDIHIGERSEVGKVMSKKSLIQKKILK